MFTEFELELLPCPLCGRTAAIATKGCSERMFRVYCTGFNVMPTPACSRQTDWLFSPEVVQANWNSDRDAPLPLFPEMPTTSLHQNPK